MNWFIYKTKFSAFQGGGCPPNERNPENLNKITVADIREWFLPIGELTKTMKLLKDIVMLVVLALTFPPCTLIISQIKFEMLTKNNYTYMVLCVLLLITSFKLVLFDTLESHNILWVDITII